MKHIYCEMVIECCDVLWMVRNFKLQSF